VDVGIDHSGEDIVASDLHGESLRIREILAKGLNLCAPNLHIQREDALVRVNAVSAFEEKGFAAGLSVRRPGRASRPEVPCFFC
jgi:hypothetical protein